MEVVYLEAAVVMAVAVLLSSFSYFSLAVAVALHYSAALVQTVVAHVAVIASQIVAVILVAAQLKVHAAVAVVANRKLVI